MASNCCYCGRRGAPKWYVSFVFLFDASGMLCFFASSSVINAIVATRQLCRSAIRTNTRCVRYVAWRMAFLLSFLGPLWCQWCSDWCALGCSAAVAFDCVWSLVSGWLTSVEMTTWSVSLSDVLGSGNTLWSVRRTLGHRQVVSSRHSATSGPPRHARTARALEVESQWRGCTCS